MTVGFGRFDKGQKDKVLSGYKKTKASETMIEFRKKGPAGDRVVLVLEDPWRICSYVDDGTSDREPLPLTVPEIMTFWEETEGKEF